MCFEDNFVSFLYSCHEIDSGTICFGLLSLMIPAWKKSDV